MIAEIKAALANWQSATPADGTLVETYFVSRGLHIPPLVALVTRGEETTRRLQSIVFSLPATVAT